MIRSILWFIVGVAVFAVGLTKLITVRRETGAQTPARSARSPTSTAVPPSPPPRSTTIYIRALQLDFAFMRDRLTVRRGTTITWVNQTATPHTVTSTTPGVFNRYITGHGRTSMTFRTPGTYQYYCALHPYMLGIITVTT